MAPIWRPQPFDVLESWIDAIFTEASDKLNDWESTFVSDMQTKVINRWSLTESQEKTLEKIYAEKTS